MIGYLRQDRYKKNEKILEAVCVLHGANPDKIMRKEKYGRFDLSDWGSGLPYDVLHKIECDSLDMCQTCGRVSTQYRFNKGWITHHCLYHYIIIYIKHLYRKVKRGFKSGRLN